MQQQVVKYDSSVQKYWTVVDVFLDSSFTRTSPEEDHVFQWGILFSDVSPPLQCLCSSAPRHSVQEQEVEEQEVVTLT